MSIELIVNGNSFFYPESGEIAWGSEATDWANAVTSGMLQKAGGTFTLLAETDFGGSYGLKSLYYKSRTTNPATAGQLRLARTDVISWRNQANNANLDLSVDASNNLLFNGAALGGSVAWGAITGTLSSQTDLQTALDAKVAGPTSATNNALVRFDSTTGKLVQDSVGILDNSGNLTGLKTLSLRNDDALTGGAQNMIQLENRNDAAASHPHIEFRRTRASNANLANGDEIGGINAHPRHGGATQSAAEILAIYTGDGSTRIADWTFLTSNSGAPAERVRITGAGSLQIAGLTANRALATDASKGLVASATTDTELGYVSGVTSAIQTQLNAKQATGNYVTALTGDVTASGPGSVAATIANSAVTLAKMANLAANSIIGNNTGSPATPIALTTAQATAMLDNLVGDSGSGGTKGLVPAPAAGDAAASKFLKADGTWSAIAGGGDMVLASVQTVTGAKTFGTIGGAVDKFILAGSTSGSTIVNAAAIAGSTTMVMPSVSGTLVGSGDTGTVTNTMLAGSIAYSKLTLTTSIVNGDISASAAIDWSKMANLTASRALVSDGSGDVSASSVTSTELGYVSGVTSAIQTQLNTKVQYSTSALAGNTTAVSGTTYLVDTSGARTITLPSAVNNAYFIVKDVTGTASTNNITIARAGSESIEGVAASRVLQTNWGCWTFVSNGTNWFILG
jgi:hypothetical protein